MDLSKRYTVYNDNIDYRIIDNRAIILNVNNSYFYTLDDAGAVMWEGLVKQKTLEEVAGLIENEYEVDDKELRSDIIELASDMEKEQLLKPL